MRILALLSRHVRSGRLAIIAITRDAARARAARALGARVLALDLDRQDDVRRLGPLAARAIYLAPPPDTGVDDPRLGRLIAAATRQPSRDRTSRQPLPRWTLISTTGVYGDCGGARVDETRPAAPGNARSERRLAAEGRLRRAVRRRQLRAGILRVPGIYAHDRLPVDRIRRASPALEDSQDVFTNHIHADDLASIAWTALHRGLPGRTVNTVDDSGLKMGEWFDRVADAFGLPRVPRTSRAALASSVSPMMLSFMSESRRLSNRRLKRELRVRLRWPTVDDTLASLRPADGPDAGRLPR
jgi:nucleoside-diphosphate-sugar epimerase